MIKLIRIELSKIFRRKSVFVILGLMVIFCFLNNMLYWHDYDENGYYKYTTFNQLSKEKTEVIEELKKYNVQKHSDIPMYLSLQTKLNLIELKEKYPSTSWQYHSIDHYLYDLVYQINNAIYVEQDEVMLEELNQQYSKYLEKLNHNEWQYFLKQEKDQLLSKEQLWTEQLATIEDIEAKEELEELIAKNTEQLEKIDFRLTKDIPEDGSYLNVALESYFEAKNQIVYYEKLKTKTRQQELKYRDALSQKAINDYIIKERVNINKQNNLNYNLRTLIEDYEIFLIMLILLVAATSICDEFRSGTIKLLLIKPYSRGKILLSKYFSSILILIFIIICLIGMQLWIGGIFFGFESLSIPVAVYDYLQGRIITYSIFSYMIIRIFTRLPFLIMLVTICFATSVMTTNTAIAIIIPLILYMFSPALHQLAVQYHLEFMRFMINMNWDFQSYLFGGISDFSFVNLKFSCAIWCVYYLAIGIFTFLLFYKKNIRNI